MWWPGRGNSGGSWLPEEKKDNMWPGRGNSGGSWPPAFPRSYGKGNSGGSWPPAFPRSTYCKLSEPSNIHNIVNNINNINWVGIIPTANS